ncbi:MAG TPA: hypothetical protein VNO30_50345 [Kofleriaceae bacterium]|nr:hypothetical protein [Kofleriaceae bacterium]
MAIASSDPPTRRLLRPALLSIWLAIPLVLGALAGSALAAPATASAISISPASIDFFVGSRSPLRGGYPGEKQEAFYSVRNTGGGPLTVSGMTIIGPDAALMAFDDTYDPFCGSGRRCAQEFSLAPGEERRFKLQCTAAQGGSFTASLHVASNAASGTGSALLSCLGWQQPIIQVSPSSLDFGIAHRCDRTNSYCGPFCETRPLTQTLTITNAAPAPSYLDFYFTPELGSPPYDDFIVDTLCTWDSHCSIGPGESLPIQITFRPYVTMAYTALEIVSQYPGQAPVSIPFYAEGGFGQLAFETPSLLGAVPVGETLMTTYTVRNAGNSCLQLHGPALITWDGLELEATEPFYFTLQAGESRSWSLACTPSSTTDDGRGSVFFEQTFEGSDFASQWVHCQGLAPALDVTPGGGFALDVTGDGSALAVRGGGLGDPLATAGTGAEAEAEGGCSTGAPVHGLPLGVIFLLVLRRRHPRRARRG